MNNVDQAISIVEGETKRKADVQYGILVTSDGRMEHAAWVTSDEGDEITDTDNGDDD